jgi:hypothetical protein
MSAESAVDLASYFEEDDFAVKAEANGETFFVIHDRTAELLDLGEVGVEGAKAVASARSSDVEDLVAGDAITIDGRSYLLAVPPRADGTGISVLVLRDA